MITSRTRQGALGRVRTRWKLRRAELGSGVRLLGNVWIYGGGRITIADGVTLDARRSPIELHAEEGAELVLAEGVVLEGGVSIEAVSSVRIGKEARIGAWSKILDNNFHPLQGDRGSLPESSPVWIGPSVRLGERCIVLPGTRVEEGARLGPGVVIGRRVPSGAVLEGFPPRRISLTAPQEVVEELVERKGGHGGNPKVGSGIIEGVGHEAEQGNRPPELAL